MPRFALDSPLAAKRWGAERGIRRAERLFSRVKSIGSAGDPHKLEGKAADPIMQPDYALDGDLCQRLPFWPHLTGPERERVAERMTTLHYRAGQTLRGGHSDCLGFVIVARGVLRAYLLSPGGREITLYRMKAGDSCVLAASCVLDAVSFETMVDAEEDSDILLLPVDVYAALMKNNLYVERDSYKMATERFSDVVAGLERLAFLNLEQRLISFLLDEAADSGSDTIHMTHEQIAVNIGSAREVVSRSLKSLAGRGWVELFRGGVFLKEKAALYQQIE